MDWYERSVIVKVPVIISVVTFFRAVLFCFYYHVVSYSAEYLDTI